HALLIQIDDTARQFTRTYSIDCHPQLLFFRNGRYVGRETGFTDPTRTRNAVFALLQMSIPAPSAADLAFDSAYEHACTRIDDIMRKARKDLEPRRAETAPAARALEASIKLSLKNGILQPEEVRRKRKEGYAGIYAPFHDKVLALTKAQAEAFDAYESM